MNPFEALIAAIGSLAPQTPFDGLIAPQPPETPPPAPPAASAPQPAAPARPKAVNNISPAAKTAFEKFETAVGQQFNVISGFRDPEHNRRVGGAKGSQHLQGNALDIDTAGMTDDERVALIQRAREAGFGGIGLYDTSLHFDVGPTRAWGPDFTSATVPNWARETLGVAPPNPHQQPVGTADAPMSSQQATSLIDNLLSQLRSTPAPEGPQTPGLQVGPQAQPSRAAPLPALPAEPVVRGTPIPPAMAAALRQYVATGGRSGVAGLSPASIPAFLRVLGQQGTG